MAAIAEYHFLIVLRPDGRPERLAGVYLAGILNPPHSARLSWDHLLSRQKRRWGKRCGCASSATRQRKSWTVAWPRPPQSTRS